MTTWNIDPSHTTVGFSVRHLMISKVQGRFGKFSAQIETDGERFDAARVKATIETASIDTREEKRDAHLRSADFFDVEKFPTLTFESTKAEVSGDKFKLHGKLSMHGVAKDVVLEGESLGKAKDPWGGERVAFEARGSINRKDFGLNWNQALEAGGVLVGEKVELILEVQAVRAK